MEEDSLVSEEIETSDEVIVGEDNSSTFDVSKLDKKSLEILEETEESDYKFKLDHFEGPLDLLLHLIKITKIDICDIFLSDITEQYLEYMKQIDEIDVDKASEFINMSATLLEIKSKHLLPKEPEIVDEEDPEERLIRQIEEYKLFKEQGEKLALKEDVGKFYREPDSTVGEFKYELPEKLSVEALINAFTKLIQNVTLRAETVMEKKIAKDKFTVAQKISQIKDMLLARDEFKFSELFDSELTRSEVINTFLALLELLKRQYIMVKQENLFDDIDIIKNKDESARLTEDVSSEYDGE